MATEKRAMDLQEGEWVAFESLVQRYGRTTVDKAKFQVTRVELKDGEVAVTAVSDKGGSVTKYFGAQEMVDVLD